jgi:NADH-quinone oxidoreductase subunit M
MTTLLVLLLALPLASAVLAALLGPRQRVAVRWVALLSTLASLACAAVIAWAFAAAEREVPDQGTLTFHPLDTMEVRQDLVPLWTAPDGKTSSIQFYIGIDGINVWLVALTALLMVPAVLISWHSITDRVNEYYAWLLVLQLGMVGVFLAFDLVLFYVFFELTLVPLFFLIGIWGGAQRQYAARKFFIYTLAGSVITLLGIIGVAVTLAQEHEDHLLTFSLPELVRMVDEQGQRLPAEVAAKAEELRSAAEMQGDVEDARREYDRAQERLSSWRRTQFWVFLALMCGFAIKVPLVPVHTWLPLAHVEAPTAGSVLLAGVLLKIGSYGFLRLCVPLAPDASLTFGAPLIGVLSVVGIIYGAFCALAQDDVKKLVAYSSVSHLGYCMLGMFALNEAGLTGSLLQMLNHGLSTGALFLLVGMLYERYHTRKLADYGGMGARLKVLAFFMLFITMSSIGLPGLNGFVGEALVLLGTYANIAPAASFDGPLLAALACAGIVLGAWYMLSMVMRVFFGPVHEPAHEGPPARDLDGREYVALVPIAVLCLVLGLLPRVAIEPARPDLRVVARMAERARERQTERPEESPSLARRADGDRAP